MLIAFFVNAMEDEYQNYTTTLLAHDYRVVAFHRGSPDRLPYYSLVHQERAHR